MNSFEMVTANKSFSGVDMVATCQTSGPDGSKKIYTLGSMQTLTYSIHMDRRPIRSIGNINAKDYVLGPRTIAGTLIFAVFNKHFAYEIMGNLSQNGNPRYTFLVDEIPPFDITVSFANEYGAQARLVIYGIRLVNEGQVMSVNDIYTENTYQFVATDLEYLTDQNGYSTSNSNGTNVINPIYNYKETTTGRHLVDTIKNPRTKLDDPVIVGISVYTISPETQYKKGIMRLTLSPWQKSGTLTIEGNNLIDDIDIDVSDYKNQSIYIALPAGDYTARYKSDTNKNYSPKRRFVVPAAEADDRILLEAPIIEYCSDKNISIYSNVSSHTRLRFSAIDLSGELNWREIPIKSRRAIINDLEPNTKYVMYTLSGSSQSMRAYATTNSFNEEPYENLKIFVLYNHNMITGNPEDYIRVINSARDIAKKSDKFMTMSTAIAIYKNLVTDKLAALKPEDFNLYEDYINIKNIYSNDIRISCYLLQCANMLENDSSMAQNLPTATVKPPIPELIDAVNCVFILDDTVEKLEFYRQYSNIAQFAIEVKPISFFNHSSGKKAFRFSGKPGLNHYVYAFNKSGHRSPKLQFYVMTDEERAAQLDNYYKEQTNVEKMLSDKESQIKAQLEGLKLNRENYERVLIQKCKTSDIEIFTAPVILENTGTKIKASVSLKETSEQFPTEMYVAISEINNALYKRSVYKKRVEAEMVEFNSTYGGIIPGNIYALWIENKEGKQVSPCVTVRANDTPTEELIAQEDRICSYYVNEILDKIKYALSNNILISDEINTCINNLGEDSSLTWNNAFEKIASNILEYTPKLSNVENIIFMLYKTKADMLYLTDTTFFGTVKFNPANYTLSFPVAEKEYMISALYLNQDNFNIKTYNTFIGQESLIGVGNNARYIIVHAVASDLVTKSGIIFIDTVTNSAKGYKINIGG